MNFPGRQTPWFPELWAASPRVLVVDLTSQLCPHPVHWWIYSGNDQLRQAAGSFNLACNKLPPAQRDRALPGKDTVVAVLSACTVRRKELCLCSLVPQGARQAEAAGVGSWLMPGVFSLPQNYCSRDKARNRGCQVDSCHLPLPGFSPSPSLQGWKEQWLTRRPHSHTQPRYKHRCHQTCADEVGCGRNSEKRSLWPPEWGWLLVWLLCKALPSGFMTQLQETLGGQGTRMQSPWDVCCPPDRGQKGALERGPGGRATGDQGTWQG